MTKTINRTSIPINSGNYFDFLNPDSSPYTIEDIALGLARCNRFTGQSDLAYTVAQHSVMVSYLVPFEDAMLGLMHDASEAFTGDVTKPLKDLVPDFKSIENRILSSILRRFGLTETLPPSVKKADVIATRTEQRDLFKLHNEKWPITSKTSPLPETIKPLNDVESKELFLNRYYEILELKACPSFKIK